MSQMGAPGRRDDDGLSNDALPRPETVLEERVHDHDTLYRRGRQMKGRCHHKLIRSVASLNVDASDSQSLTCSVLPRPMSSARMQPLPSNSRAPVTEVHHTQARASAAHSLNQSAVRWPLTLTALEHELHTLPLMRPQDLAELVGDLHAVQHLLAALLNTWRTQDRCENQCTTCPAKVTRENTFSISPCHNTRGSQVRSSSCESASDSTPRSCMNLTARTACLASHLHLLALGRLWRGHILLRLPIHEVGDVNQRLLGPLETMASADEVGASADLTTGHTRVDSEKESWGVDNYANGPSPPAT